MATDEPMGPTAVDAAGLQFIAEGVTELAGFELAAISIVHEGRLHTIAIAGDDEARAELSHLHPRIDDVLAELENAEEWGALRFVPHERQTGRLDAYSYIQNRTPAEDRGRWHPHDLLVALLEDDYGVLRGVLSVDLPRHGQRPDAEQRRVLELYARQAGRAVIALLDRAALEYGMRRERATSDYRGQLIDALSHQLQNPVAAISGNLELLLDDLPPGDPAERALRAIERATGRIQEMVTDLLVLARVNNPDRPLQEVPVDLGALVRDSLDGVALEAATGHLTTSVSAPSEPLLVTGDPGELDDLVSNLVSNAIKYSDPGGSVSVTLEEVREGGSPYVELCVRDRGIGIAEEEQGRLFEEFFRSENVAARSRPGTGLGLPVVDRVVRRHRGRIEVESELGVGTTFRVLLPAA